MNPNPNPNYNQIRGLTILINDIRNCKTKEAETKRIEKELDKIRKKFNQAKALSGYDKKKYVWKLIYIYILGYNVDFGYNYAADLITSIKFSEKMTGYIAMSILFKENNPEIDIMVNSIKNDLNNKNTLCQSMALGLACNLNNTELLIAISNDVLRFMTHFTERQLHTVKKALVCLTKIVNKNKELHDPTTWPTYLSNLCEMKYFEILLSYIN